LATAGQKANIEEQAVFEYARRADGRIVKITAKNSHWRKCEKCGCQCPCSCADCKPFCCSSQVNSASWLSLSLLVSNTRPGEV